MGFTAYESRETQIKIKIEKEAIHQFCTEFSFHLRIIFHVVLNVGNHLTFPIASNPLSNRNNTPKNRKAIPNPANPTPISERK